MKYKVVIHLYSQLHFKTDKIELSNQIKQHKGKVELSSIILPKKTDVLMLMLQFIV